MEHPVGEVRGDRVISLYKSWRLVLDELSIAAQDHVWLSLMDVFEGEVVSRILLSCFQASILSIAPTSISDGSSLVYKSKSMNNSHSFISDVPAVDSSVDVSLISFESLVKHVQRLLDSFELYVPMVLALTHPSGMKTDNGVPGLVRGLRTSEVV